MDVKKVTRRHLLGSAGLTAGTGLLAAYGATVFASEEKAGPAGQPENKPTKPDDGAVNPWKYVQLDPAVVAAEAYRLYPEGGCMYGVFASMIATLAKDQAEPFGSFPCHMMKYGAGGVGHWGSVCGTINGGAALIGLFERDKKRSGDLIAELFSWYEKNELPNYQPKAGDEAQPFVKNAAGSILCHVSAAKWCLTSGNEAESPERKERCRRLTADVAAKTVELLNANLVEPCKFAGLSPEVKTCLKCHNDELHDTVGKMQCNSCHPQLSSKHPAVPNLHAKSAENLGKPSP